MMKNDDMNNTAMEPNDPEQSLEIQRAQAKATVSALEDAMTATAELMVKRPSQQDQARIIISDILPAQQSALALLQRHVDDLERANSASGPLNTAAASLAQLRQENNRIAGERDQLRARLDSIQQLLASVTTERDMLALHHQAADHPSQLRVSSASSSASRVGSPSCIRSDESVKGPVFLSGLSSSFSRAVPPSTAPSSPSMFNIIHSVGPPSPSSRKRSASAASQRPVECVDVPSSPEPTPVAKRPRVSQLATAEDQIAVPPKVEPHTSLATFLGMPDAIVALAVESDHLVSNGGAPSPSSRNPNQHQQPYSEHAHGLHAAVPHPMSSHLPGHKQPLDEPRPEDDDSGDDIVDVTDLQLTPPPPQHAFARSLSDLTNAIPNTLAAPPSIHAPLAIPRTMASLNVRPRYLDGVLQVQQTSTRVLAHCLIPPPPIDPPVDPSDTSIPAPPDNEHDDDDTDSIPMTNSELHPTNALHLAVIQQQYGSQITATLLETMLAQGIGVPVLHRWLQQQIADELPTRSTSQVLRVIHTAWVRPVLIVKELERQANEETWRELAEEYLATAAQAAAADDAKRPVQVLLPPSTRLVVLLGLECCGLEAPTADARVPALGERRYALRERVALVFDL